MSPLSPSISKAWRCILSSRSFLGGISSGAEPRLKQDLDRYNCGFKSVHHSRGYGTGRNHRSWSQRHGIGGRKPTTRRTGRRGGFDGGFQMPDFDPGSDQLKNIFESQMDSSDPIGGLDLEEVGPIEGNFRDDDDSEAEDFYRNAEFHTRPNCNNIWLESDINGAGVPSQGD
ncbi:hypothetical protein QQ045_018140 [Rhodiola kirilowii]